MPADPLWNIHGQDNSWTLAELLMVQMACPFSVSGRKTQRLLTSVSHEQGLKGTHCDGRVREVAHVSKERFTAADAEQAGSRSGTPRTPAQR